MSTVEIARTILGHALLYLELEKKSVYMYVPSTRVEARSGCSGL